MTKKLFILTEATDQDVTTIPFVKRADAEKEMAKRFLDTVEWLEEEDEKLLQATLDESNAGKPLADISGDWYGINKNAAWWDDTSSGMDWQINEIEIPDEVFPSAQISHEDRLELIGCFIDVFEDFLTEKGVEIENDERQDCDEAIIYGSDYGDLEDSINEILLNSGLLKPEKEA